MLPDDLKERVTLLASNPILRRGVVGEGTSHERPFFAQAESGQPFSATPYRHDLPALPRVVADALSFVPADREIHVGPWTFVSPNGVCERRRSLGFAAFAHRYAGMGHVDCLGYCPERDVVFQFLDGGANGYDREANATRAAAMTADDMCARAVDLHALLDDAACP